MALAILSSGLSHAQQAPDMEAIKAAIENPESPYYYPSLMGRYMYLDTTLTAEDYQYLYYGYAEQADYMPLLQSSYADSLTVAFSGRTQPTPSDIYRIIHFAEGILEVEPFNMRDMNVLAFAYSLLEQNDKATAMTRAVDMIASTIMATGTGLDQKSPWWVIYNNHAEDVMNILGARFDKPIIVTSSVEFFPVRNMPEKRFKGYYFNILEIYKRRPDYLDNVGKQKRKMEFNPLYNPRSESNIFKQYKR